MGEHIQGHIHHGIGGQQLEWRGPAIHFTHIIMLGPVKELTQFFTL